jgi:sodium-dependent phosphate transporter
VFYILYKGGANFKDFQSKIHIKWTLPASIGCGLFCGLCWIFLFGPCARRRVEARLAGEREAAAAASAETSEDPEATITNGSHTDMNGEGEDITTKGTGLSTIDEDGVADEDPPLPEQATASSFQIMYKMFADNTYNQDLKSQSMHESPRAQQIWDEQENFDENAEGLFNYIQVFTACLNSFAHGANDVANTIAPMSAIIQLYQTGMVEKNAMVQKWVLAFGGASIVLGLLFYGYRVMKSVGYKLTKLSPSRGASAELGSSLTVVTASFLGIPVSSTQCIVGAVTGVGLLGGAKSIHWWFLLKICCSWAVLFTCAVLLSAGIFSFAAYSPNVRK